MCSADLAEFRRAFVEDHPTIEVRLCPPLGPHPLLVDILLDRLGDAG